MNSEQWLAAENLIQQKLREKKPHRFLFHPMVDPNDSSISMTSDGTLYKTDKNGTIRKLIKGMTTKERRRQREQSLQRSTK